MRSVQREIRTVSHYLSHHITSLVTLRGASSFNCSVIEQFCFSGISFFIGMSGRAYAQVVSGEEAETSPEWLRLYQQEDESAALKLALERSKVRLIKDHI